MYSLSAAACVAIAVISVACGPLVSDNVDASANANGDGATSDAASSADAPSADAALDAPASDAGKGDGAGGDGAGDAVSD
jgi:hypothetical protein